MGSGRSEETNWLKMDGDESCKSVTSALRMYMKRPSALYPFYQLTYSLDSLNIPQSSPIFYSIITSTCRGSHQRTLKPDP